MNPPLTAATAWVERYENLRRYVLEGRQRLQAQPLGLALWLAKGMAGWMRQWSQLTEATAPPPSPAPLPGPPTTGAWQQQLTQLLAQMTLAYFPPPGS